jgi:hypothetical protein
MSLRTSASLEFGAKVGFIPHDATANVGESAAKEVPQAGQSSLVVSAGATSRSLTKYK